MLENIVLPPTPNCQRTLLPWPTLYMKHQLCTPLKISCGKSPSPLNKSYFHNVRSNFAGLQRLRLNMQIHIVLFMFSFNIEADVCLTNERFQNYTGLFVELLKCLFGHIKRFRSSLFCFYSQANFLIKYHFTLHYEVNSDLANEQWVAT